MSLYDRNYTNQISSDADTRKKEQTNLSAFIKSTYALLTASMIAATVGAYVGMNFLTGYNFVLFLIVEFALLFGMNYATSARKDTLALVLLFAFTFITGLSIAPILNFYIANGASDVITKAFLTTAVTFAGLTIYAMNTKNNFTSFGKPLIVALILVIVVDLLNVFIFKSSIVSLAISSIMALVFCGYILFDTQNIIRGNYKSPIMAAVGMYLNILNLFLSLLRIFGMGRN